VVGVACKELDAVTDSVNEKDQGEIKDSAQHAPCATFWRSILPRNPRSPGFSEEADCREGQREVLVSFIELEHH